MARGKSADQSDDAAAAPDAASQAARLLARQQRQHLLALYITACNHARRLRRLLLEGESPTGYGSPLTPLSRQEADAILRPVEEYLRRLRDFVAQRAADELAAHEAVQPPQNTRVWAANLIERLRQTADELSAHRLKRYGVACPEDLAAAEQLRQRLVELTAAALEKTRGPNNAEADPSTG